MLPLYKFEPISVKKDDAMPVTLPQATKNVLRLRNREI